MENFTIWRDLPVKYRAKERHHSTKKNFTIKAFALFYGDVPVAHYNSTTKKWEDVENKRGNAYAARKRLMYRKKKK